MTQPTPGEWEFKVAKTGSGDCGIGVPGSTGIFIECYADIRRAHEGAFEEAQANARIVCAAKPMLAALESVLANAEGLEDQDWYREAERAIALAKGETP